MPGKSSVTSRKVGEYELLEKLGEGAMSAVFRARHSKTKEIVAVKIAALAVAADPVLSRRFELEYEAVHPLAHRNLVKVIEHGLHGQLPFLVLEYIDGSSLAQHIAKKGALREHEAISLLLPIADALTYLHGLKLIHRDVKPHNILLSSKGQAKLADLGLIKNLESVSQLTRPNMGLGTIQFAAPEQFVDAQTADPRSDIYSLAATFYSAITGEYPFGKGSMTTVVRRKMKNHFEAPIKKLPKIRPAFDAAIRLAMSADPKQRPASVSDFVGLLTGWKKLPTNIALPGIAAKVALVHKIAKKESDDRRRKTRYDVDVTGSCRALGGSLSQRWDSTIVDISTTGVCLQTPRRFEAGSKLEINFSLSAGDSMVSRVVRVCWSKATDAKSWLLGCEFVNNMSDEDLDALFADLMGRTKME